MTSQVWRLRRLAAPVVALVLIGSLFLASRTSLAAGSETKELATHYGFTKLPIKLPEGHPQKKIRQVNPAYKKIEAWISSVGAGVGINDLDGDGLPNDLCVSDPRTDEVAITPTPDSDTGRYEPFFLDPEPLLMDGAMAPTGCVPGDFNEDGRMDVLVYYMGRTPIAFLAKSDAGRMEASAYQPIDLVPVPDTGDGRYHGPRWQTTAVAVDDFDGDGHDDIYVGNYFPDSDVLDPSGVNNVAMNDSMSHALNGAPDHILRFQSASFGPHPDVTFREVAGALPDDVSDGWVLASAAADLDGDLLPELYIANDFGPDRLLYNKSTPGDIRFAVVEGQRGPTDPKSTVVGHDSFKGMGVDFGDLDGDGRRDMFVSNITTSFGIVESNLAFFNTTRDDSAMRRALQGGMAPFDERSARLGLAWVGWGWDAKLADFDNDGTPEIVQTDGFVKGEVNRWPQLQELATANDELLKDPRYWPNVEAGDDVAGRQRMAFFAKGDDGKYANLSQALGIGEPTPTRGVAIADTAGNGALSFAVAQQWEAPVFYHNKAADQGAHLGLRLLEPGHDSGTTAAGHPVPGSPATGAEVRVEANGRTYIGRVDGGSGHSGKRSTDVHLGLGDADPQAPLDVELRWRDRNGEVHSQTLRLRPGTHTVELSTTAQEVGPR